MRTAKCGTPSGYLRHKRKGEDACQPCKTAAADASRARREAEFDDDRIALVGEWRPNGRGTLVFYPAPIVDIEPEPIIGCHTCGALIHEPCRTKKGERTGDHIGREIPKRCECGAKVEKGRRLCQDCARVRKLDGKRSWHARQKVAA